MMTNAPQVLPELTAVPAAAWPKMDLSLLDEQYGAPPPFPLDALPPFWRTWTEAATANTGAPADYAALSLLTAAGSLVAHRGVMPAPGWAEPCILWTALVGPPSCGKTPALEAACQLLRGVWKQRRRGPKTRDGRVSSAPLFTNATTIDVLLGVLRETWDRGVLLVRDEHGGWLSHMARGTRDGNAHAFWLSTWCQRTLDLGWRGKTVDFDSPSVPILGTVHPDALVPALSRDDGGVLSRFLFVRPIAPAAWLPPTGADMHAPEAVAALLRLYEQPWRLGDLPLAGEALAAFGRFRRAHHAPMADLAGKSAAWWGKGPSQVLRLAGVLTFLDWAAQPAGTAEPQQVPAWAVEAAVRLWRDYLWPHAQATFRIAGAGGEHEGRQRQVLRWLVQQRLPEVSREHIRREALQQALNAATTERLIADLVEGGWLRPVELVEGGRGRRRRRWHVHPGLWAPRPSEIHVPEAHAPGACPHPELVEGASAVSEDDLRPPHPSHAVPAIPASAFDAAPVAAVEQVDLGAAPTISAIRASDSAGVALPLPAPSADVEAAAAVPAISASDSTTTVAATAPLPEDRIPTGGEASAGASPGPQAADDHAASGPHEVVPAVSATRSDAAIVAAPSSAPLHEPASSPSDELLAICASELAANGHIVLRPVCPADNPATPTAHVGDDGSAAPQLGARARRRLGRRERSAQLRNGVNAAPHATAA